MRMSKNRTHVRILLCLSALGMALALVGCHSGDNAAPATVTDAKLTVYWNERSEVEAASVAPSSALSLEVILEGAALDGTDYRHVINRHADPAAYFETYTLDGPFPQGTTTTMQLRCYAQADAGGDVVGVGAGTAAIPKHGSIIGDVSISGTTSRTEVIPDQQINVGDRTALQMAVYDEAGRILTVSPGSVFWSLQDGAAHLQFDHGQAVGVSRGVATVIATVDRKPSAAQTVSVLAVPRAILLGTLAGAPADTFYFANGVSADGTVVVGNTQQSDGGGQAFRWTEATGMEALGMLPGFDMAEANAISADGSVIVGACSISNSDHTVATAFRWTAATGMVPLLDTPESQEFSIAKGVSADGSVVVGQTRTANGEEAFVWASGQVRTLGDFIPEFGPPYYSQAFDVSADGRTVVGEARYDFDFDQNPICEAFRWQDGAIVPLGYLHEESPTSCANAISADGRVITGNTGGKAGAMGREGVFWTAGTGVVSLIPGTWGIGLACSGDGSVIVGDTVADIGGAIIWDSVNGGQFLNGFLLRYELTLPDDYGFISAAGISHDGRTIVGCAAPTNGADVRAYLIDLP
jgi:probable HAF family extracellular repeat protein